MALRRWVQLLSKEALDGGMGSAGQQAGELNKLVYTSPPITISTEVGWALLARIEAAPTGTTPGIVWEVDLSDNGAAFTRVGAAIAAQTAIGALLVPYYTGSTQGLIIPAYNATHTYQVQVLGTIANADNVFPSVSLDFVEI